VNREGMFGVYLCACLWLTLGLVALRAIGADDVEREPLFELSLWRSDAQRALDVDDVTHEARNKLYLTYTTSSDDASISEYAVSVAKEVMSAFQVEESRRVLCLNAASMTARTMNTELDRFLEETTSSTRSKIIGSGNRKHNRVVVLHGVEKLQGLNKQQNLNFIYRLTDSSVDIGRTVVLMVWNTVIDPVTGVNPVNLANGKEYFGSQIDSEEQHVNGMALAGRIARLSVQPPSYHPSVSTLTTTTTTNLCEAISAIVIGDGSLASGDDVNADKMERVKVVLGVVATLATLAAASYYWSASSASSTADVQTPVRGDAGFSPAKGSEVAVETERNNPPLSGGSKKIKAGKARSGASQDNISKTDREPKATTQASSAATKTAGGSPTTPSHGYSTRSSPRR
jgi:hypothetical protein